MPAIKLKKATAEYLAEKEREAVKEREDSKKDIGDDSKKNIGDNSKKDIGDDSKKDIGDDSKKDIGDDTNEKQTAKNGETVVSDEKPHNFLEVEILYDKRKRTLPVPEQKLIEWLDSNFEKKPDFFLPLMTLYEFYTEVCQNKGDRVVDCPVFNKFIRDKFGKCFGFQENSPYRALIKERKRKEKKPQVQGETLQIKLRDIITEVINEAGNPHKGLRFNVISKAIIQKYPAQRIDIYQKKLKYALERGALYGHIEQVRGVGMCGYYRVPGEPTKEEEKKEEKNEKSKEEETKAKTNDASTEEDEEDKSACEQEVEAEVKEGDSKTNEEAKDAIPSDKKKKKRKKKVRAEEKWARSEVEKHCDPRHLEDVFPLAITYQSDPKTASVTKIRSYIFKHYHVDVPVDHLKKSLESGVRNGMWELASGNSMSGSYHLLTDTFQPGRSDSLKDRIAQALVACHEPKQASSKLIKAYIAQYHPKFSINEKPHIYKKALERACNQGVIKQLSGIGSVGTFQLIHQFNPSPALLAGDVSDEEEDSDDDEDADEDEKEYVPRPTKHKRLAQIPKPKQVEQTVVKSKLQQKSQSKATEKSSSKRSFDRGAKAKVKKYTEISDEESEEEAEYLPKPSKRRSHEIAKTHQLDNDSVMLKSGKQNIGRQNKTVAEKKQPAKLKGHSNNKPDTDDDEEETDNDSVMLKSGKQTIGRQDKKVAEKELSAKPKSHSNNKPDTDDDEETDNDSITLKSERQNIGRQDKTVGEKKQPAKPKSRSNNKSDIDDDEETDNDSVTLKSGKQTIGRHDKTVAERKLPAKPKSRSNNKSDTDDDEETDNDSVTLKSGKQNIGRQNKTVAEKKLPAKPKSRSNNKSDTDDDEETDNDSVTLKSGKQSIGRHDKTVAEKKLSAKPKSRSNNKSDTDDDEETDNDSIKLKSGKQNIGRQDKKVAEKKLPAKPKSRSNNKSDIDDDEETDNDFVTLKSGKQTIGRHDKTVAEKKQPGKPKSHSYNKSDTDDDEENDIEMETSEYTPRPSKSRGGGDKNKPNTDEPPANSRAKKMEGKNKLIEETKDVESKQDYNETEITSVHKQTDSEPFATSRSKSSSYKKIPKKRKLVEVPEDVEVIEDICIKEVTPVISIPKKHKKDVAHTSEYTTAPQPKKHTVKHKYVEETEGQDTEDNSNKNKEAMVTAKRSEKETPPKPHINKRKNNLVEESETRESDDEEMSDVVPLPKKKISRI